MFVRMRSISHLIIAFISNFIAILTAVYLVAGFTVQPTPKDYLIVTALLTALNVFLRPVLKFILTPVIILTLGLFTLVLNAALLYGLDYFSESLTITGLKPLAYATLVITAINFIVMFAGKRIYKKD